MVTITSIGKDKCALSGKEAAGVYCQFDNDLFSGFLSWRSLKQLSQLHLQERGTSDAHRKTGGHKAQRVTSDHL